MDDHQRTLTLLSDDMTSEVVLEAPSNDARENKLLGLPRELRDQIWSYVLASKYENVNHWSPSSSASTIKCSSTKPLPPAPPCSATFRVNWDAVTGLTLPISLTDTHMIRNIELQVDHELFLRRNPKFRRPPDRKKVIPWFPKQIPEQFIEQMERFGSSEFRAERCIFYVNSICYNKEFLPVIIPVLHALKGFETLILKIAVCPPRFSSPPSAWLLSERFKMGLEAVLGEGEFTEHEGRCCLVFRPRDYCWTQDADGIEAVVGAEQRNIEDGSVG